MQHGEALINLNTFDLNLLRVFEALGRHRSVSIAADRLGLSQPAVSNALNRLRELLDDPLFVRTRQGMEPTALATRLRQPLEQSLANIRTAIGESMSFDPATAVRTFKFLMVDVGEIIFLPPLLEMLAVEAPSINLRVLDANRQSYEDYLENGTADMVVGDVALSDTFCSHLLLESGPVALLDRAHASIEIGPDGIPAISYEQYLAAQHIAIAPRGIESRLESNLSAEVRGRNIKLTIPHTGVLSAILPGTSLIATVPDFSAWALSQDHRLRSVPLPFAVKLQRVYLWWHKRQDADTSHRWMREALTKSAPRTHHFRCE